MAVISVTVTIFIVELIVLFDFGFSFSDPLARTALFMIGFFISMFLLEAFLVYNEERKRKGHIIIDDEKATFDYCFLSHKTESVTLFHDDIIGSEPIFRRGHWNLIIRCKGGREETIDGQQFTTADLSAIHARLLELDFREQMTLQKHMDDRIRRNRTIGIVILVIGIVILVIWSVLPKLLDMNLLL